MNLQLARDVAKEAEKTISKGAGTSQKQVNTGRLGVKKPSNKSNKGAGGVKAVRAGQDGVGSVLRGRSGRQISLPNRYKN